MKALTFTGFCECQNHKWAQKTPESRSGYKTHHGSVAWKVHNMSDERLGRCTLSTSSIYSFSLFWPW